MPFAGKPFPNEPEGAEAAIYWHLEQIEFYAIETVRLALSSIDSAAATMEPDAIKKRHIERLTWLEGLFPMTAQDVRKNFQKERLIDNI